MASTKLVIGGAAAGAAIGVRVARSLYGRWRAAAAGRPRADRLVRRGHQGEGARPARLERPRRGPRRTCARRPRRSPPRSSRPRSPTPRSPRRTCSSCARSCAASWSGSRRPTLRLREAGPTAPSRLSRIRVPSRDPLLVQISDSAHTSGPSARPKAATLEFREATKRYPGQDEPAVNELSLTVPAGEICVLVGPSGCGKTTAMRMVNRMIDITDGRHPARRPERPRAQAGRAAPRDRLRDPAGRPVPAPERRGQHRHRSAAARLGPGAHPHARRRAARAREPRPGRDPRAATRPSSPAGSASAWAWRARWPWTRR